jgi:predicted nucleotidyltransferase
VDLTFPLQSLVPTLDSAVLEVLAGTESGLSATQIARLAARGSRQGQALVLDRLVEHGLVIAEPANRGYLYRLNRDHVLADAVLSACRARRRVLDRLTEAVKALDPEPVHVSVFGSFARREAGPDSDIDLLVVLRALPASDTGWSDQLQDLADRVLSWTGNRLECLTFTVDELHAVAASGEPIVESLRDHAVTLSGVHIDTVLGGDGPWEVAS